ncbi:YceI family protein [Flavihumibacter petaseus]|uniref:YceI family protein n=1 Tax=Flavihumibacter petaseus NBRC 106054 TaxID=1220578 RepID=A0A0E9N688_9BACT|nr:YceI family protein [Flavihumibacter petaseus]GAO45442.1 YceI family protein [Flavihumibacter petaseus NBRC 106054]
MAKIKWALDPTHSELGFKIRHLMISNVSGSFRDIKAAVETEDLDFGTAQIQLTAAMDSIFTNNEQRDNHLRNSDFFEVEKYPELLFESTRIEKVDDETFALHGDITLKGQRKPVKLNVEFNGITKDPWGGERAGFQVTGKLNRTDWGVNFNAVAETGGLMLGEEVKINSEIQLVRQ